MDGRTSISSLKFLNYIVNKVNYKTNNTEIKKDGWKLNFDIKNTTKVNQEKNKMSIVLNVDIFKGVEDAPFYMEIEIIGYLFTQSSKKSTISAAVKLFPSCSNTYLPSL